MSEVTTEVGRSRTAQREAGKKLREEVPRSAQATFAPDASRDPIALLRAQNEARIADLVPLRRERMSESAFAFYRGAAGVMAYDLAGTANTGVTVQACGDAHLSNFGLFASRDRDLVFDVNDFDETSQAPWEWDLKRLIASIVIAGRQNGLSDEKALDAARQTSLSYRTHTAMLVAKTATERYFSVIRAADVVARVAKGSKRDASTTAAIKKASRNTSERALRKLTTVSAEGSIRINDQPPLTARLQATTALDARSLVDGYRASVPEDVAELMKQFWFQDAVVKVVGVGSVGTRCYLVLLTDADGGPLFVQIKEATASVLEAYAGASEYGSGGHRVVAGQRIMQASGDPFLGHFSVGDRSFYVRQYRDMKGGVDPSTLTKARDLADYGSLCAMALARAHSQSGVSGVISGYLGTSTSVTRVDDAFAQFGAAYAVQNDADYQALLAASDSDWYTPAR